MIEGSLVQASTEEPCCVHVLFPLLSTGSIRETLLRDLILVSAQDQIAFRRKSMWPSFTVKC